MLSCHLLLNLLHSYSLTILFSLKHKQDLLCLPRPLNPPVLCLEKQYSAE